MHGKHRDLPGQPSSFAPFRCFVIGNESLVVPCAETLLRRRHDIRGIISAEPSVLTWAAEHGIAGYRVDDAWVSALRTDQFDYLFSITNLTMLPPDILALPRIGAINFHDGPLPRYAGLNSPTWAIMQQERQHGVTWHMMTSEPDTGDVLKQELFPIAADETALTLNTKCYEAAIRSFAVLIDELAAERATLTPQDLGARTYFARTKRPAAAAVLDFNRDATELDALIRGLQFGSYKNPLALPKLCVNGEVLVVLDATVLEDASMTPPGTVVEVSADWVRVATVSHDIALTRLATIEGTNLTPSEAARRLQLRQGSVIPTIAPRIAERLTALAERTARHEPFWRKRLTRLRPVDLPYAERGQKHELCRHVQAPLLLPSGICDAFIAEMVDDGRADAVVAGFAAYLARLTGETSFHVGFSEPALRNEVDGATQLFASHVPVQIEIEQSQTLREAVAAARGDLATVRKRLTYARDAISRFPELSTLRGIRDGQRLPVRVEIISDPDAYQPEPGSELTVAIAHDGGSMLWAFDAGVYQPDAIARMQRQFIAFLTNASTDPSLPIGEASLLDVEDRRLVLETWNDTDVEFPANRCIHELIEDQAQRTPEAVALVCGGERLSYRELNTRANKLARYLQGFGVGPDVLVGLYLERSIEMVVAVLGVHKAGGAYVPLDPTYPRDRIGFMIEDAAMPVLLTQDRLVVDLPASDASIVPLDTTWAEIDTRAGTDLRLPLASSNLAYVIYTSGSTGKPKGVMVEHHNVVNFFTGMDERIESDTPGVWLAVTSLSFDISVLELLWTLARGFTVVLYTGDAVGLVTSSSPVTPVSKPLSFSLFYFASDQGAGDDDLYRLLLEGARFADRNGFEAVWTPERHFHSFGGLYPNPSVTAAAVAAVTERVKIRAGSVVLPLHSPIRVAEEWSVVDNLSRGRAGISIASGWQPNDFVFNPENFATAKDVMLRDVDTVRRLWRGEAVPFPGPLGEQVEVRILPRPVQPELPVWVTAAGNPETFRLAGAMGANILTHLLGQNIEEVAEKIAIYRQAWQESGHRGEGQVTLMLHTFVGDDDAAVKETVRGPMKEYLRSSVGLIKGVAWSFPIFKNHAGVVSEDEILASLSNEEMDALLDYSFERYYETSGLFGTPERCIEIAERLRAIGVDEIGCLIDFGVETEMALESLKRLNAVRAATSEMVTDSQDSSIPALIARHAVTHLQCTPSMATMLLVDQRARTSLRSLHQMMVGGEAFPTALAAELTSLVGGAVTNMYGPTETTIWSSTHPVTGTPASIPIGRPIANTQMYVVDRTGQPAPIGVPGELLIGGDGVVRGYLNRPELTAERFLPNRFVEDLDARVYRTGDLARYVPDGTIEFLGRLDHQVKIRGYRIELGEIESVLNEQEGVREAVVVAREDTPGATRLVAYAVAESGVTLSAEDLRAPLVEALPDFMVPAQIVFLDRFPLTPNAKIDRKALPRPEEVAPATNGVSVPPAGAAEETVAAIWREVLNLPVVGREDNFFDLGGHSLLAVQVHRRLTEQVGPRLSLTDLFRFPTVRAVADFLEQANEGGAVQAQSMARAEARQDALARRRQRVLSARG